MRDKMLLLAYAVLGIMAVVACDVLVSQHTTSVSDLSIAQSPPYEPRIVIDLGAVVKLTNVSVTNITVYIDENQSQNVTIWKGDKMVCYIPRSELFFWLAYSCESYL